MGERVLPLPRKTVKRGVLNFYFEILVIEER
jgi:hypothetical protein